MVWVSILYSIKLTFLLYHISNLSRSHSHIRADRFLQTLPQSSKIYPAIPWHAPPCTNWHTPPHITQAYTQCGCLRKLELGRTPLSTQRGQRSPRLAPQLCEMMQLFKLGHALSQFKLGQSLSWFKGNAQGSHETFVYIANNWGQFSRADLHAQMFFINSLVFRRRGPLNISPKLMGVNAVLVLFFN